MHSILLCYSTRQPFFWFNKLAMEMYEKGKIKSDILLNTLLTTSNEYRG